MNGHMIGGSRFSWQEHYKEGMESSAYRAQWCKIGNQHCIAIPLFPRNSEFSPLEISHNLRFPFLEFFFWNIFHL